MSSLATLTRRDLVRAGIACAATAGAWPVISESARAAAGGTINFADIGVGDPSDWSLFTNANGWNINLVAIGNAPSAILNVLVAGGGTASYDVINIVGGMQKPLVENDLIEALDTARIPAWSRDRNVAEFLAKGTPGFNFVGYEDKLYGVPTVLQGDSFAYLPEKTGALDSYAALFDSKFKGYVALEDNYIFPHLQDLVEGGARGSAAIYRAFSSQLHYPGLRVDVAAQPHGNRQCAACRCWTDE
jgi:putative spermidine/putrescine transport system substrate-binding protein